MFEKRKTAQGDGSLRERVFDVEFVVSFFLFIKKSLPFPFIHFKSRPIAEVESYTRGMCLLGRTGIPCSVETGDPDSIISCCLAKDPDSHLIQLVT